LFIDINIIIIGEGLFVKSPSPNPSSKTFNLKVFGKGSENTFFKKGFPRKKRPLFEKRGLSL